MVHLVCTHVKCQYQVCICKCVWFLCLTRIVNIKYVYVSVYGAFWMYVFVSYSNCEYQVCICKCVCAFWMYVFVSYSNCEYQVCICKCVWCILDVCFCVITRIVNIKYAYVSVYGAFWMYVFVSYSFELWISSMYM